MTFCFSAATFVPTPHSRWRRGFSGRAQEIREISAPGQGAMHRKSALQ
ncbi:hypothetical protein EM595_1763 [Duffyella gerundensis]|uniref:Uncharacterized protein n=1 Tax=Duffyella gerundensis TaxID=1619313 RepID=A0A0U5EA03_9GAMM|nr:hypothetical protein EM595_1763 [Duffyella gerundensis]